MRALYNEKDIGERIQGIILEEATMENLIECPVCGKVYNKNMNFCIGCGCNLQEVKSVSVTLNPDSSKIPQKGSLRNQVFNLGQKAQQGITGVTSGITDKARDVTSRASNIVVQEKVTEAMGNLVNLMINVSKDVVKQVPVDMVNAIDLEAEVNFVAFTIGVSIDLAEINKNEGMKESPPKNTVNLS
jgi:hypothetical protein